MEWEKKKDEILSMLQTLFDDIWNTDKESKENLKFITDIISSKIFFSN